MCSLGKRTSIVLSERFTDERGVVIFGPTADRELQGVLGELDRSVAGDGTMKIKIGHFVSKPEGDMPVQ